MRNQMRVHAAISEGHHMEPRCARRKGEVGDADNISVADAVPVSIQRIERAPQQTGIDLAVGPVWSSDCEPSSRGSIGNTRECKIDKKTARKYQDIELRHN
jgi:hypothetical protein